MQIRLFSHKIVAGTPNNVLAIRGGEWVSEVVGTVAQAVKLAKTILLHDSTVGRVTIHNGQVIRTIVR